MKRNSNIKRDNGPKYNCFPNKPRGEYVMPQQSQPYFGAPPTNPMMFRVPPPGHQMYNPGMINHNNIGHYWKYSVPPPPLPPGRPMEEPPPPPEMQHHHPPKQQTNQMPAKAAYNKAAPDARPANDSQQSAKKPPAKRKTMSSRYGGAFKDWDREDALKALALENEYLKKTSKAPILLLRFPDPELSRSIVSSFSPNIDTVHFQLNAAPRHCFVHLHPEANVEDTIKTISKIPFGTGFVSAELRRMPITGTNTPTCNPDDVDPYTLYIGNLTPTISTRTVKGHFPGALRVDMGFAQRMKGTRYAFIRYDSVEKAMEGFRNTVNKLIESRSLVVRFLRKKNQMQNGHENATNPATGTPAADGTNPNAQPGSSDNINNKNSTDITSQAQKPGGTTSSTNAASTVQSKGDDLDSKENVLIRAGELSRGMQSQKQDGTNANSKATGSNSSTSNLDLSDPNCMPQIKEECMSEDDLSEDEELPSNSLLGARYTNLVGGVKEEPEEHTPLRDEPYFSNLEYDEDFGNDDDDDDVDSKVFSNRPCSNQITNPDLNIDKKPALDTLNPPLNVENNAGTSSTSVGSGISGIGISGGISVGVGYGSFGASFGATSSGTGSGGDGCKTEHSSFVKNLYDDVRRAKATESSKRPRDDLDDLFAKLNSDDENDSDSDSF